MQHITEHSSQVALLHPEEIHSWLSPRISRQITLQVVSKLSSTNQYVIDHYAELPSGYCIFAEQQTQGRGRQHKEWFSPYAANLYGSILWNFAKHPDELSGLSLAVGIAVANTLERYGISPIRLKWPNDVLWQCKKISGVLIEILPSSQAVIGIGLNVVMPPNSMIDQAWIDMATIVGHLPNRNQVAAYLIEEVSEILQLFAQEGLHAFLEHWQALDVCVNQPVSVFTANGIINGIARGINQQGALILLGPNNQLLHFSCGEVSLRQHN